MLRAVVLFAIFLGRDITCIFRIKESEEGGGMPVHRFSSIKVLRNKLNAFYMAGKPGSHKLLIVFFLHQSEIKLYLNSHIIFRQLSSKGKVMGRVLLWWRQKGGVLSVENFKAMHWLKGMLIIILYLAILNSVSDKILPLQPPCRPSSCSQHLNEPWHG